MRMERFREERLKVHERICSLPLENVSGKSMQATKYTDLFTHSMRLKWIPFQIMIMHKPRTAGYDTLSLIGTTHNHVRTFRIHHR
jgi:hypothetical protein